MCGAPEYLKVDLQFLLALLRSEQKRCKHVKTGKHKVINITLGHWAGVATRPPLCKVPALSHGKVRALAHRVSNGVPAYGSEIEYFDYILLSSLDHFDFYNFVFVCDS